MQLSLPDPLMPLQAPVPFDSLQVPLEADWVARQIYVSSTTIKTHVARVLDKLGRRDRVQAVLLAYETGIIRPGAEPQQQTE